MAVESVANKDKSLLVNLVSLLNRIVRRFIQKMEYGQHFLAARRATNDYMSRLIVARITGTSARSKYSCY